MRDGDKEVAALAALAEVVAGMTVGLGTGSTAAFFAAHLGKRVRAGLSVTAVATSLATEQAARAAGIPVIAFEDIATVDLTVDGADEFDDRLFAIKGAGGAMLREKIVAAASRRMIVIADGSKHRAAIGRAPVPVEILPFAREFVTAELRAIGAGPVLRMAEGAYYRSDQGNLIADCAFASLPDPVAMAAALSAIPGILGHGLFLTEVDTIYSADGGVVTRLDR
ncbi:ribose-5-phosphate isomerase RpiA [Sphingomonas sp. So64.6b]|uniref:ribose-5-phosphate isomerase RpiA n=1 Tax=Sphingomonas sp. So64.6b TaxID=2997354 RepID=UPI001603B4AC|nr:ribose-5-phosphate isomerase RpiA [Sphingomonas sp. So64.6b]QNA85101.1 ribose-5-phosphate isomerase RpiA [Sphingomonas sp. So64.6b]